MSYLVGYGLKYPIRVHHRGASVPSIFVQRSSVRCVQGFDSWYRRSQADPNVIHGALVGGPDQNDNYSDDRTNYEQSEPTLSGTAPLVGLFAKLSLGSYGGRYSKPYQTTKPPDFFFLLAMYVLSFQAVSDSYFSEKSHSYLLQSNTNNIHSKAIRCTNRVSTFNNCELDGWEHKVLQTQSDHQE